jgi:hypothetical protein
MIRLIISMLLPAILLMLFSYIGLGNAAGIQNFIYPNNSALFHDAPYSDWLAKWWGWWVGIPDKMHPYYDAGNPEKCSLKQSGPVWFLPPISEGGPDNNFHCNVPIGKDIMIPISITECDPTGAEVDTDKSYIDCVLNIETTHDSIAIDVDGKSLDSKKLELIKSKFFNITYTNDSVQFLGTLKPGTYRALIGGLSAVLHGLPAGDHNINFRVVDTLRTNTGPETHISDGTYKILIS